MPKPSCHLSPAANSLDFRPAGRQVHKPRCLGPAAHRLDFRMAGCQVPKPRCLSPAADSLDFRIAGCQVPKPRCLSPAAESLDFRNDNDSTTIIVKKTLFGVHAQVSYIYIYMNM